MVCSANDGVQNTHLTRIFHFLLAVFAGWMNGQQQHVIGYLNPDKRSPTCSVEKLARLPEYGGIVGKY